MSREFCRDVPDPWECSKLYAKKKFVLIFRPLHKAPFSKDYPGTVLITLVTSQHAYLSMGADNARANA